MNWLVYVPNPAVASVRFKEIGLMEDREGEDYPVKGVSIVEIPPVAIVEGTYDQDGNELTPPVYSPHRHFNIRITPHASIMLEGTIEGEQVMVKHRLDEHLATFLEDAIAANVPAQAHKSEVAWKYKGLVIIEPDTVATQRHVVL